MNRPTGSRTGFALILALVVITILAVAGLELSREVKLSLDLASNFKDRTRARLLALDGLNVAAQAILDDDPVHDSLDEPWAEPIEGAEEGTETGFRATLEDLSGRFNLNNLVDDQGRPDALWTGVLGRLLAFLEGDPSLVQVLVDWLDPDDEARSGGAEAREYSEIGRAYKPRNGPLLDLSELKMLKGFDRALLEGDENRPGLLELVTVQGGNKLNINTMPVLLIQSLDAGMGESLARAVIELREERPIRKIKDIKSLVGMTEDLFMIVSPLLEVKSSWFRAESRGRFGRAEYRLRAILQRSGSRVEVVAGEVG